MSRVSTSPTAASIVVPPGAPSPVVAVHSSSKSGVACAAVAKSPKLAATAIQAAADFHFTTILTSIIAIIDLYRGSLGGRTPHTGLIDDRGRGIDRASQANPYGEDGRPESMRDTPTETR